MTSIEYDAEADALYIRVAVGEVARTEQAGPQANLDFAADGTLLGVEIFEASRGLPDRVLHELVTA